MGADTRIEWADHTFNPWIGCTAVSPACDHCYAERFARRLGVAWGPRAERRRTAESTWRQPLAWDRKAAREGRRFRVFCASLADVFDNQVPESWRHALWALIHATPHLDWLLLTKRPQNISKMLPDENTHPLPAWGQGWPNVWLGTTVENQAEADRRIPRLLAVPAAKRFLSCEPLLEAVDLRQWLHDYGCGCGWGGTPLDYCPECGWRGTVPGQADGAPCPGCSATLADYNACPECDGHDGDGDSFGPTSSFIHWVICGGESGPGARPMHPDWARSLRDQCSAAGVPFFFKQWGEWEVSVDRDRDDPDWRKDYSNDLVDRGRSRWINLAGGRGFHGGRFHVMRRVGKKAAGRLLDGCEHIGAPA